MTTAPTTSTAHRLLASMRDPLTMMFLATVLISLVRAPDQPAVDLNLASSTASVDLSDLALTALGIWLAVRIIRRRDLPRRSLPILLAGAAFAGWILVTAAANGTDAFVAAGKFVEIGVLTVGAVYVLKSGEAIWPLLVTLLAMNIAADMSALHGFIHNFNARQPSFLGEHDLAALSTMTAAIWFASLYRSAGPNRRIAQVAGVAGVIGITLGAALASLLGVYLAVAAISCVAIARGEFRWRSLAVTIVVVVAITGAILNLRSDNLGFLRAWFGTNETNAASQPEPGAWSQRLIFAYIGGRIFLAKPVLGTGWYPQLPPSEYARYLPAARRRFPDQPAHYFPPERGSFIPQMTYDQVLYELGLVGAVMFAALLGLTIRESVRTGRHWPRSDPEQLAAYVPPAWTASLLGVLAGIALFGGASVSVLFWLTFGAAAALTPGAGRAERSP